jgi:hypothetical protein
MNAAQQYWRVRGHLPCGFKENAADDFARSTETLRIGEAVVAPESADGLALLHDKRQRRMCSDSITGLLEFAVEPILSHS